MVVVMVGDLLSSSQLIVGVNTFIYKVLSQ